MANGKLKTHKATAKRFKVTASGKLKHNKQNDNAHLKTNKNNRTLRRQEGQSMLSSKAETKKLKALMN
jgi:large subunit ribosomal protein L35